MHKVPLVMPLHGTRSFFHLKVFDILNWWLLTTQDKTTKLRSIDIELKVFNGFKKKINYHNSNNIIIAQFQNSSDLFLYIIH